MDQQLRSGLIKFPGILFANIFSKMFIFVIMDTALTPNVILLLFTRYIGQPIWIRSLYAHKYDKEPEHLPAILCGIKEDALQVQTGEIKYWIPLNEELKYYEIKMLLKPLSRLTERAKETANSLPVTVFITQYYVQMGYDMPVFISPGHPLNCKYMYELGLADYRTPHEIEMLNNYAYEKNALSGNTLAGRV